MRCGQQGLDQLVRTRSIIPAGDVFDQRHHFFDRSFPQEPAHCLGIAGAASTHKAYFLQNVFLDLEMDFRGADSLGVIDKPRGFVVGFHVWFPEIVLSKRW